MDRSARSRSARGRPATGTAAAARRKCPMQAARTRIPTARSRPAWDFDLLRPETSADARRHRPRPPRTRQFPMERGKACETSAPQAHLRHIAGAGGCTPPADSSPGHGPSALSPLSRIRRVRHPEFPFRFLTGRLQVPALLLFQSPRSGLRSDQRLPCEPEDFEP